MICRLCLKAAGPNECINMHEGTNNICPAALVKELIPELYLGCSLNTVVCLICYGALRNAHEFRLQCLRSDKLIGIYISENQISSFIDLQNVVDYWVNVYTTKPQYSHVAKENISDWFGLRFDTLDLCKRESTNSLSTQTKSGYQSNKPLAESLLLLELEQRSIDSDEPEILQASSSNKSDKLVKKESELVTPKMQVESSQTKSFIEDKLVAEASKKECDNEKSVEQVGKIQSDSSKINVDTSKKECEENMQVNVSLDKTDKGNDIKQAPSNNSNFASAETTLENSSIKQNVSSKNPSMPLIRVRSVASLKAIPTRNDQLFFKPVAEEAKATPALTYPVLPKDSPKTYMEPPVLLNTKIDFTQELSRQLSRLKPVRKYERTKRPSLEPNKLVLVSPDFIQKMGIDANNIRKLEFIDGVFKEVSSAPPVVATATITSKQKASSSINMENCQTVGVISNKVQEKVRSQEYPTTPKENVDLSRNTKNNQIVGVSESKSTSKENDGLSRIGGVSKFKYTPQENDGLRRNTKNYQKSGVGQSKSTSNGNYDISRNMKNDRIGRGSESKSTPKGNDDLNINMINYQIGGVSKKIKKENPVQEYPSTSTEDNGVRTIYIPKEYPSTSTEHNGVRIIHIPKEEHLQEYRVVSKRKNSKSYLKNCQRTGVNEEVQEKDRLQEYPTITKEKAEYFQTGGPGSEVQKEDYLKENSDVENVIKCNFVTNISSESGRCENNRTDIDEFDEEMIDIKEEPLDYDEADLAEIDKTDDSGPDEDTWSASETSLMNELTGDIPVDFTSFIYDIEDEEFDKPEFVHINNISLKDIPSLIKERANLQEAPLDTGMQGNENNAANKKTRKKFKLVLVNDGKDQKSTDKPIKKRPDPKKSSSDGPICVLHTNINSEGDYINDHDYLASPYRRNDMTIQNGVICLLCHNMHPTDLHLEHMKTHINNTICNVCKVNFHNVFLLNMHVRSHTFFCGECGLKVMYIYYQEHMNIHKTQKEISLPSKPSRETKHAAKWKMCTGLAKERVGSKRKSKRSDGLLQQSDDHKKSVEAQQRREERINKRTRIKELNENGITKELFIDLTDFAGSPNMPNIHVTYTDNELSDSSHQAQMSKMKKSVVIESKVADEIKGDDKAPSTEAANVSLAKRKCDSDENTKKEIISRWTGLLRKPVDKLSDFVLENVKLDSTEDKIEKSDNVDTARSDKNTKKEIISRWKGLLRKPVDKLSDFVLENVKVDSTEDKIEKSDNVDKARIEVDVNITTQNQEAEVGKVQSDCTKTETEIKGMCVETDNADKVQIVQINNEVAKNVTKTESDDSPTNTLDKLDEFAPITRNRFGSGNYLCNECNKCFASFGNWRSHVKQKHSGVKMGKTNAGMCKGLSVKKSIKTGAERTRACRLRKKMLSQTLLEEDVILTSSNEEGKGSEFSKNVLENSVESRTALDVKCCDDKSGERNNSQLEKGEEFKSDCSSVCTGASTSVTSNVENTQTKSDILLNMGKTNAEMCKNYYNRKKAVKEAEKIRQGLSVKNPIRETRAERVRACRLRKKMLSQPLLVENITLANSSEGSKGSEFSKYNLENSFESRTALDVKCFDDKSGLSVKKRIRKTGAERARACRLRKKMAKINAEMCKNYYNREKAVEEAEKIRQGLSVKKQRKTGVERARACRLQKKMDKINAEMCKNYYNRMKAAEEAEKIRQGLSVKKQRKTGAERARACRLRKKMLSQPLLVENVTLANSSEVGKGSEFSKYNLENSFESRTALDVKCFDDKSGLSVKKRIRKTGAERARACRLRKKMAKINAEMCKNYYNREKAAEEAEKIRQGLSVKKQRNTGAERARACRLQKKMDKINAEMCKNYYNRMKAAEEAEKIRQGLSVKKQRKTGAERARACRLRKKMLSQALLVENVTLASSNEEGKESEFSKYVLENSVESRTALDVKCCDKSGERNNSQLEKGEEFKGDCSSVGTGASTSFSSNVENTHTKNDILFKMGKTNAEMCKKYYNRKKAAKEAEKIRQGLSVKKPIKTGAERTRACRLRKKMLSQALLVENVNLANSSEEGKGSEFSKNVLENSVESRTALHVKCDDKSGESNNSHLEKGEEFKSDCSSVCTGASTSVTSNVENTQTKNDILLKMGKTNAEMCKNYYNGKKAGKEAEKIRQGLSVKKTIRETRAERVRACRLRKKMLSQPLLVENITLASSSEEGKGSEFSKYNLENSVESRTALDVKCFDDKSGESNNSQLEKGEEFKSDCSNVCTDATTSFRSHIEDTQTKNDNKTNVESLEETDNEKMKNKKKRKRTRIKNEGNDEILCASPEAKKPSLSLSNSVCDNDAATEDSVKTC